MLILRTSPTSPFGRKVRIAIDVVGMTEIVEVVSADTSDPSDSLRLQNPLGKIPTLLLESGEAIYDSRVIVEYLDIREGRGTLIPSAGPERIAVLRLQALADGILDAAILKVYEKRFRPESHHVASWLEHQQGKIDRSLAWLVQHLPVAREGAPNIGEITLATALGYLTFRFGDGWRTFHRPLADWLESFEARAPVYGRTVP